MINYEIFENQKLIIIKYKGELTEPLLIDFISFIFDKIKNTHVEFVLNDFRESIFSFNLNKLRNIIEIRNNNAKQGVSFKTVHLIDNVHQTTYSVLFKEIIEKKYAVINVCSTIDYAIDLLNLDFSANELENKINMLKNKFKHNQNE